MPIEIRYAARSDVGLVRKQNQDSGYAGQHLLVLADGMGGPAGGDIASSVAVAHLSALDQDSFAAEEMLPALDKTLKAAHDELISRSRQDSELAGLGTTCIAMLRSGRKLAMVHIGDSRAYVLRDGELMQVTKDHSFVQYLLDTGQIDEEQAEHHPQKSVILRVLGDSDETVVPDKSLREAVPGERWLLCSDGLHGVVSKETITDVLTSTPDLDECADTLVQLALRGGGPDNVTVVLFDVLDPISDVEQTTPQVVGAAATDRLRKSSGTGSAAAKAAALTVTPDAVEPDETEDELPSPSRSRRKRWGGFLLTTVLLLAAIAGGIAVAHQWIESQFYAIAEGNRIVVYQGIPQQIGPIAFARRIEVKEYTMNDLLPASRNRLQDPVRRDSHAELNTYLESLVKSDRLQQLKQKYPYSPVPNSGYSTPDPDTLFGPFPPSSLDPLPPYTVEVGVPRPEPVKPPQEPQTGGSNQ